jgi:arylsulfatase A-like enzyme
MNECMAAFLRATAASQGDFRRRVSKDWKKLWHFFQALEKMAAEISRPWKNHPLVFQASENALAAQRRKQEHSMKNILRSLAMALLALVAAQAADATRPNVVIFLVDDMGVMDTSVPFLTDAAGRPQRYPLNNYYRTPNMERLAERGIRFNNFCAMSVCSPTRISILTGQNAARHRTTNWINPDKNNAGPQGPRDWNWQGLKPGDVTLPGLLRAQGYRTIHVGKAHFGPREAPGAEPRNLGFEINVAGCSIGAPASYYGKQNYGNAGGQVKKQSPAAVPHLEKYHGTDTFLSDALTFEAQARVSEAVKAGQPFFLYLAHYAVHAPFNSDPRFAAHYRDSGKPAQAFATLIEGMDKSLGDLLAHLDTLGVAENTLVFFLGDNGSDAPLGHQHEVACAAPLRGKKGSHYEGGMRVPFIAAWAKPAAASTAQRRLPIAAGAIQSQQAAVYDLFPTLLALTGGAAPASHALDGARLDTLLAGRRDSSREETFLMHYPHAPHRTDYFTVFRRGEWKVVYHYLPTAVSGGSHYQLFHLARDPFEQNDLAATRPVELRQMMQGLIAALEQQQALYPVDKDGTTALKPKLP